MELCFPQLVNTSCRIPVPSPWKKVLVPVLSALTIMLNLLTIISIAHFRQLHSRSNSLLLSLAVSDLLVGFLLAPGNLIWFCWMQGDHMCMVYNVVGIVATSSSVGDVVLISVDRYVAICNPLRYRVLVTERRVRVCVCVCWTGSLFCGLGITHENLMHAHRLSNCHGECLLPLDHVAGTVDLVVTFCIPICAIVALNTRVFLAALSHARASRRKVTVQVVSTGWFRSELKTARNLGILVPVFLACLFPYYVGSLMGTDVVNSNPVLGLIFFMNSLLNPMIYFLFYPWCRKAWRLIVTLRILEPGSSDTVFL